MPQHLLMNLVDEQEMRVAIIADGRLQTIAHERLGGDQQNLGNIYLGKVTNVEPSLDAAFVDLGGSKNGFLHVDDVNHGKGKGARIEKVLKPGQEILVQITKESIKDKGPCLTGELSIPGRYLVLVQDPDGLGVSKRIEDPKLRKRLKSLLAGFDAPEGFGFIVRTAGAERSDEEITTDYEYLSRLWNEISGLAGRVQAPACVYREADVVVRTLREMAGSDVESVILDSEHYYDEARAFAMVFMPELANSLQLHREELPLFSYYGVEDRLATMYDRQVEMPSGGNICIEQTEALVSIDVNSAKNRESGDVESTALHTNLEAVQTIAEQLILRDLGGLIIIDFIDMEKRDHQRLVQLALRRALLTDKARTSVATMSRFGLVEMTRQRTRPSHKMASSQECPWCKGTGAIKTPETFAIEVMRSVRQRLAVGNVAKMEVVVPADLAVSVLNSRCAEVAALENQYKCTISFTADSLMKSREFRITASQRKRGRSKPQEKPVHPGLLATWLETKAKVKAEVDELKSLGSTAIEKELLDHMNGRPPAAKGRDEAKEVQKVEVPVQAPRQPTLYDDALALRQLLFVNPEPVSVCAGSGLASAGNVAKHPPSQNGRGSGNRRRRRR